MKKKVTLRWKTKCLNTVVQSYCLGISSAAIVSSLAPVNLNSLHSSIDSFSRFIGSQTPTSRDHTIKRSLTLQTKRCQRNQTIEPTCPESQIIESVTILIEPFVTYFVTISPLPVNSKSTNFYECIVSVYGQAKHQCEALLER